MSVTTVPDANDAVHVPSVCPQELIPVGSLDTEATLPAGTTALTVRANPVPAIVPESAKLTVGLFGSFVARTSVPFTGPAPTPAGGANETNRSQLPWGDAVSKVQKLLTMKSEEMLVTLTVKSFNPVLEKVMI